MTKYLKQNIMKAKLKVINFFCMVVINLNLFMISLSYIKFGGSLDYIISFVFKQTKKVKKKYFFSEMTLFIGEQSKLFFYHFTTSSLKIIKLKQF